VLKLSKSKKYDEIILLNKFKNQRHLKRPFSFTNTKKLMNNTKPVIGNRNNYFSIVLNSFGNNNNYTPLVTLKNFNIKKINF
jgi:ABC-type ATPase with predicted acetyltransferase domain